jgi:hypothetical protein
MTGGLLKWSFQFVSKFLFGCCKVFQSKVHISIFSIWRNFIINIPVWNFPSWSWGIMMPWIWSRWRSVLLLNCTNTAKKRNDKRNFSSTFHIFLLYFIIIRKT